MHLWISSLVFYYYGLHGHSGTYICSCVQISVNKLNAGGAELKDAFFIWEMAALLSTI